ncbi:MAG: Na/Pi symporter [Candidatus Zixiibacteriota bacterium]
MAKETKKKTSFYSLPKDSVFIKIVLLLSLLYLFILSITMMGGAFKLFGREFAETIFQAASNPLVGLMIGLLSTAIIQSSSTTTSIIVGLVGSGMVSFECAIPMVMGANIGTTITNTIVSLAHISRNEEYRRAFAGASLHDFFNICSVIVLFPLQVYFDVIGKSAHAIEGLFGGFSGVEFNSPLADMTKPVSHYFLHASGDNGWAGILISLFLLFIALRYIVKILKSLVLSRVEIFFQRYIFRNPALGFLLGVGLTVLVQSSSITTSLIVPLCGAGVLHLHQIFPYQMGANIGTTITAFLASFVTGSHEAVSVAFAHLLFNVYGICIFWPLQIIPISLARFFSKLTQKSKLVPIIYILVAFFLIPGLIIYFMG